jgi:hypothetical protein
LRSGSFFSDFAEDGQLNAAPLAFREALAPTLTLIPPINLNNQS